MFDNPIFFLILISLISAISEWLGKRRKARRLAEELGPEAELEVDGRPSPVEPETERPRERKEESTDWEERLRRMLEGEDLKEGKDPKPIVQREPSPAPTPVSTSIPQDDRESSFHPAAPSPVIQTPSPIPAAAESSDTELPQTLVDLNLPAPAMERKQPVRGAGQGQVNFRSKESVRSAIVASVVLGPPKGQVEDSDLLRL